MSSLSIIRTYVAGRTIGAVYTINGRRCSTLVGGAADAVEATLRSRLGLTTTNTVDFAVSRGALVEVPVYEDHTRGKNWLAIITIDPAAPGGLRREFARRGRGPFYYLVGDIAEGDAVEFGADYYSGSGRRSANRWYGVVRSVTSERVTIEPCDDPFVAAELAEAAVRAAA